MRNISLSLLFFWVFGTISAFAGTDPTEAALIAKYTAQEHKALQSFEVAQVMMSTGHIWTQTEISGMTKFQKEYNSYLKTFHDLVGYAASVYGIYYESNQLGHNISRLNQLFDKHSTNSLAVALSTNRNKIYRRLLKEGMEIASDIKLSFFDEDKRGTQWDRIQALSKIQPKLKTFNRDLRNLIILMEYTTMKDVWHEINDKAYPLNSPNKAEIIKRARMNWIQKAKQIK